MAINAKLQTLINIKNDIGTAITNKGGTITGATPFFNYASEINNISTGTPQTVFQDSTGAKWARTNAVNLTNVSNNVTSDFNWWQPANNTTSDAILNVGTVGANISGNIQLVPVNQVNIAQYTNIVINDTTGAKYVGYNGFDSQTNPTPTGNIIFNRWLLNNSASGTVIFANTTVVNGGTFNGPNSTTSVNISNMAFIGNTVSYGENLLSVTTNNGFIYAGGITNQTVWKFHESNLAFVGNTPSYGGNIFSLTTNNGFIYAGGTTVNLVKKYHESNLAFVGNTANYGGIINAIAINNGFIYVGGEIDNRVKKFHESNLAFVGNTVSYGGEIRSITTNNGFIYVGGQSFFNFSTMTAGPQIVQKYHESNLAFVGNTASYGATIFSVATNNGFLYAAGPPLTGTNRGVSKFNESTLELVGNTVNYGTSINSITINNGFIYVGGDGNSSANRDIKKYHESNLVFVSNTVNYGGDIRSITTNNGFIYAAGLTDNRVKKYQEQQTIITPETLTFYTATKIKE